MNTIINDYLVALNDIGRSFCNYAGDVFIQSSVLIVLLLIVDFLIRKRVRAVFRYWIWMLVFVKLILPPTLCSPTGIGYWFGDYLSAGSVLPRTTTVSQQESIAKPVIKQDLPEISGLPLNNEMTEFSGPAKSQEVLKPAEITNIQPSRDKVETAAPVLSDRAVLNPITWQAVAFGFWLVGVLVISVLLIQRILFVRGLIAQGEAAGGDLVEMMNQCRQKVGVDRNIEVRLSNTVLSPAVCGLFRPIVLIPKSILDTLSPDNLRAVLIHELAHIKRGDLWINCVQTILQIIYFYNPFVWLANAVVRKIREQAVDEMVLVSLGAEAKSYSNTLIDIAEIAFFRASLSLRLIGVVESKKELQRRIRHMLNRPVPKSAKIGLWGLLVVIAMGAVLLPMAKAQVGKELQIEGMEKQFTATLPNGVTVELIGVCEHPSEGKQWWRPDGSSLLQAPYESREGQPFENSDEQTNRLVEFAVSLTGRNIPYTDVCYQVAGSVHTSGSGDAQPTPEGTIKNIACEISKSLDVTEVRLGITAGQWKTITEYDGRRGGFAGLDDIIFSDPIETQRGTTIAVRGEWGWEGARRITAVDKNGDIHTGGWNGRSTGLKTLATTTFHNVKPEQIRKYQLQFRPYEWVEFKNVSLKPDMKANMQVEVECVPAAMVGTWFFDNPQGDEEQMAIFPDGRVVVLYSNGHKDQTNYLDGFIELAEYDNAGCKMFIQEDGTLVQYFTHSEGKKFGKRWKRIDPIPRANLLRSLTGQDTAKADAQFDVEPVVSSAPVAEVQGMSTSEPGLGFEPVDSQAKTKLLRQMEDMAEGMIQAFNEGNVGILLSYFTDDAIVLPDQLEAAIGKDALRKHYLQQIEQQAKIHSFKDVERQIWICGDYIFEAGKFVTSFTSPALRFVLSDWQKSLTVFNKQPDGSLKIRLTASNPTQIPEDGRIPEAIEPEAVKVVSSPRPSNLPLNVSEKIRKDEDIFHKKFVERDAEGAVDFYTENAVLLPWGKDAIKGKSEILRDINKSLREEPLVDMTQKVVHVEGNNQILFVVNLFTWTFKDASSGENVTFPGKGVHVWVRQKDGSWKILFDLHNVSVPIPGR